MHFYDGEYVLYMEIQRLPFIMIVLWSLYLIVYV